MKILIVGLGVQGVKRKNILKKHKVLTVDIKKNMLIINILKMYPLIVMM